MKHLFTICWLFLVSMIANSQNFDGDKPATNFQISYSENFDTWDANKFYGQWEVTEPAALGGLGQNDFVTNGEGESYLDFVWPAKRVMTSHLQYVAPYAVEIDLEYPIPPQGGEADFYLSNRGGLVIRALPIFPDDIQVPGEIGLWNKVGIAFFPEDDGNSMVIQISGEEKEDGTTAQTRINVPKPEGIESLWGRYNLKIEDFGATIYGYLGGEPFFRIDFSNKVGKTYTSGKVYDSGMLEVGAFDNMTVGEAGKVSIGMRDAFMNLYNVSLWEDNTGDAQLFDNDKPQINYDNHYSDDFNSWNESDFYAQWSAIDPQAFGADDITDNGALAFVWANKRIIASNTIYSDSYVLEAEMNYATPSNRGGVVIRTNPEAWDDVQAPANAGSGFNKAGIAFYPTLDGQHMTVQFTGVLLPSGVVDQTKVLVPKPENVVSLMERGTLRIEDTGSTIYVYYNGDAYIRIDLDELTDGVFSSGTVYDSEMNEVGIFYNKIVDENGRIFIAQRDAALQLHSVSVWDNPTVTSINSAAADSINIFPNPVASDLTISSSSTIKGLSIADISGKIVYGISGLDKTTLVLNVESYQPGIYIVRLVNEKGINVHKLIIRK